MPKQDPIERMPRLSSDAVDVALQRRARMWWLQTPVSAESSVGARIRQPEAQFLVGKASELLDDRNPEHLIRLHPRTARVGGDIRGQILQNQLRHIRMFPEDPVDPRQLLRMAMFYSRTGRGKLFSEKLAPSERYFGDCDLYLTDTNLYSPKTNSCPENPAFTIAPQSLRGFGTGTKCLPKGIVAMIKDEGYQNFSLHAHTSLWLPMDAKNSAKGFGVQVRNA
jgi:hypothetical protein